MKRKRAYGNQKLQNHPALAEEPGTGMSCQPLHKPVSDERTEENYPNALGIMIATIIKEISEEAGGIANLSRSLVDNTISNAQMGRPHVNMNIEENESRLYQNPEYKQQELNAALEVIKKTMKLDAADPFNRPVDPVALGIPDYFDIIDTPMDFGTIRNNLENGLKYMNSADVFKDVQCIWYNCLKYNKKGDEILVLMKRVKTCFTKYWRAAGLHNVESPAIVAFRVDSTNTSASTTPFTSPLKHTYLARKYGTQDPKNKNYFTCNFCSKKIKAGAYRLKLHLVGGDKNVTDCPNCPEHVREEVRSSLLKKQTGKEDCQMIPRIQQRDDNGDDEEECVDLSKRTSGRSSKLPPQKEAKPKDSSILSYIKLENDCPSAPLANSFRQLQQLEAGSNQVAENQLQPVNTRAGQPQQSSSLAQASPELDEPNNDSRVIQNKRQSSGPARCVKSSSGVGRIKLVTNEVGQPVGREALLLTSFLDLTAQDGNLAPLTYPSWSKMPIENKENMWQKVLTKFDIDPSCRSWVLMSLESKWRSFKSHLKTTHYDSHTTDEERLADCDERVLPDQWSVLVSNWSSENLQSIRANNKASSAKGRFSHTSGTKSFARIHEEEFSKRPDRMEPAQLDPVNESTPAVTSQSHESPTRKEETSIKKKEPQDDVYNRVMGPSRKGGDISTFVEAFRRVKKKNAEVVEVKEKLKSVEQTCAQMAAQMSAMVSMMAALQKGLPAENVPNDIAGTSVPVSIPNQPEPTSSNHEAPAKKTRGRKKRR